MDNQKKENKVTEICNQCGRECSINDLHCNKGRNFWGQSGKNKDKEHFETEKHRGSLNRRDTRTEGRHCGHKEKHRHYDELRTAYSEDTIEGLIRKGGHYLHHSIKNGRNDGQGRILALLMEHPKISQKEIQELMGIQAGSISELMKKLDRKEFIIREKDEEDRRMSMVMLTDAGKKAASEYAEIETKKDLLYALSDEEQKTLQELLKKLLNSWEEIPK